jgi:outer membrane protein assembly factor BamB
MYATIAGKAQLVVQTRAALTGVDPETGKPLWSHDTFAFMGMNILNPTIVDDAVFTSTYGGGSFLFNITANKDKEKWEVKDAWKTDIQGYARRD